MKPVDDKQAGVQDRLGIRWCRFKFMCIGIRADQCLDPDAASPHHLYQIAQNAEAGDYRDRFCRVAGVQQAGATQSGA
ncbi:hypothetical protein GALL_497350 [mine drainage metagenome]|uniref:Uncharacterized protein n=1 Tax=mine drainage metagenome TaxID=410659 RepID=A0A1J5PD41_9ZZZZ